MFLWLGFALNFQSNLDGRSQTLPKLYTMAASDLHDVTAGSNGGYTAGVGYDLVTGRGTPIANLVANDLLDAAGNITGRFRNIDQSKAGRGLPAQHQPNDQSRG